MKGKGFGILAVFAAACLLLPSCGVLSRAGTDLMAGVEAVEWPEDPEQVSPGFTAALNDFSWNLVRALDDTAGNRMVSPASVFIALSMTLNGAAGQTLEDMKTALAAGGLSVDDINKAARDWMIRLNQTDGVNRLSIVNSIWYREGFAADPAFLQKNADFYAAAARSLDFSDAGSADRINAWVSKATNGKIKDLIETIDADTVMFLINAIYFNAVWQTPFKAEDTADGTFHSPDGDGTAKFMSRTGEMNYLTADGAEGVLLPYGDGRFAMVALLPEEGSSPQELAAAFGAAGMAEMLADRETVDMTLYLPKFEAEYKVEMKDALERLGMGIAFEAGRADFSLMQENRAKNLYIGSVTHKTYIRVDELGTEAAAATKVEMKFTAMPVGDKTLRFDRPFLYSIIDFASGLPLFIGIIEKP